MKDLERCSLPGQALPRVIARAGTPPPGGRAPTPPLPPEPKVRGHASLRAQAGALFLKNAVYQRRHACSNVCLLSAPLFFCVMLLAVQLAINRLLLTGPEYEVRMSGECRNREYRGEQGNLGEEMCVGLKRQAWPIGGCMLRHDG
jgi:hypothetical protein